MKKPIAVLEAEDLLVEARARAAAAPDNAEFAMQVRMAERHLELTTELQKPRTIPQEAYDMVRNTVDFTGQADERAYHGGAE